MKNKLLSIVLSFCLIAILMPISVNAAETFTYKLTTSPSTIGIGSEFDVVFSLTNYSTTTADIRGIQVDVKNIDTSVFEVVSHSASITDATAASNKTSYSSANNRIRYVYAHFSGTLNKSSTDLFTFKLKVKDTLTEAGSIDLPVTVKIEATDGQTTQESTLTIKYTKATVNVEVEWGKMEFTYCAADQGEWNPQTHTFDGGTPSEWKCDENANKVTVTNKSSSPINVLYEYKAKEDYSISGTFKDSNGNIINNPVRLESGNVNPQTTNAFLFLSGSLPSETTVQTTIGTVTITIEVN